MTSRFRGPVAGRRGLPAVALMLVAIVAFPSYGHAQNTNFELKAITDLPCPFDALLRLAEVLQPGATPAGLLSVDQQKTLVACLGPDRGSSVLPPFLEAINKINRLVANPPPEVTPALIKWLEEQLKSIAAHADAADAADGEDCKKVVVELASLFQALLEPGRAYLSPARPLRKGQTALAAGSAPITFDTLDGDSVARENRVETRLSWISAAYGVGRGVAISLVLPYHRLDLPDSTDPSLPGGETSGVGDVTVGALWRIKGFIPESYDEKKSPKKDVDTRLNGKVGYKSVLSLHGSLTAPTGDSKEALGTGYWSWTAGVRADRIFRSHNKHVTLVPHVGVWGGGRAGEPRWGAAAGLDWPLIKEFGSFVTLLSQSDRVGGDWVTYADGRLGFRFRAGALNIKRLHSVRFDGSLSYNRPLNEDGFRPTEWVAATVQISWGGPKSGS